MSIPGNYDMTSSDNYDGVLKAMNIGLIKRKLATSLTPRLVYFDHGNNKWTQKTLTSFKNFELTFVLGEEFDEITPSDHKARSTFTLDGNKLTHVQKTSDFTVVIIRIFNGDEMTESLECNGQVCKRVFKKVP